MMFLEQLLEVIAEINSHELRFFFFLNFHKKKKRKKTAKEPLANRHSPPVACDHISHPANSYI